MSVATKRTYNLTFILDLRGREDTVEDVIDFLKETMQQLDAGDLTLESRGVKEFAQTPDKRFTSGYFLRGKAMAPPEFHQQLNEKLRLDRRIHRIFVESAE